MRTAKELTDIAMSSNNTIEMTLALDKIFCKVADEGYGGVVVKFQKEKEPNGIILTAYKDCGFTIDDPNIENNKLIHFRWDTSMKLKCYPKIYNFVN